MFTSLQLNMSSIQKYKYFKHSIKDNFLNKYLVKNIQIYKSFKIQVFLLRLKSLSDNDTK